MAKKKYEEANIQAIAETIRSKTGTDTTYDTSEMASGVNEVYDKGRTDEWSEFWDEFQQNGTRTDYSYAFFDNARIKIWNTLNLTPKYDIKPTTAERCFGGCTEITDFVKLLDDNAIVFDTSKCTNLYCVFSYVRSKSMPVIDMSVATDIRGLFEYCFYLESIEKIVWSESILNAGNSPFRMCYSLTDFESEGTLAISISFADCPLTVETIKSLILHLKKCTGTEAGKYTLTLKDICKTAMANLGTIEEFNNKTYDEYISDIGWVLG